MSDNSVLYQKASDAIGKLFEDMSVSKETTIENLENIIEEIEIMIEGLKA